RSTARAPELQPDGDGVTGGLCVRARSALWKDRGVSRPRVHVTGPVPAAIDAAVRERFDLADRPVGADGILVLLTAVVDGDYLDAAGPQLKVVANYGVGVNNIDLEAARARGVVVANTPDVLTRATAELAITLTLSLLRRVTEGDRMLRARKPWGFSL